MYVCAPCVCLVPVEVRCHADTGLLQRQLVLLATKPSLQLLRVISRLGMGLHT